MAEATKVQILLVDDDAGYRQTLSSFLRLADYVVTQADSVSSAIEELQRQRFRVVLADMRLSDHSDDFDFGGLEVAKEAKRKGIPTIVITAFKTVEAARQALRSRGAEPLALDLVFKTDGPQAVLDALEACLRNTSPQELPAPGAAPRFMMDLKAGIASLDGEQVRLPKLQYKLLAHLYRHRGAVCSHSALYEAVYGEKLTDRDASIDRRLERLVDRTREKIEEDTSCPKLIVTESGRGYRLTSEGD
jgi:DNA-binding response OmpR family regulator